MGKQLGEGGYSRVFECVEVDTGAKYAAKVVDKRWLEKEQLPGIGRLVKNEIGLLEKVREHRHPNVLALSEHFENKKEGRVTLITELLRGKELFELIAEGGPLEESRVLPIVRQLLNGLKFLHDLDIVHLDIKPENLMFREPNHENLVIIDFGTAKFLPKFLSFQGACGSLGYNAPEVVVGESYGKNADVWGVGIVSYIMLSGHQPFLGEDREVYLRQAKAGDLTFDEKCWSSLSADARDFLKACLTFNPEERPQIDALLAHPWLLSSTTTTTTTTTTE